MLFVKCDILSTQNWGYCTNNGAADGDFGGLGDELLVCSFLGLCGDLRLTRFFQVEFYRLNSTESRSFVVYFTESTC